MKDWKAMEAAIRAFEDTAQDAVAHVGQANYREREAEAARWVRQAAEDALKALRRLKRQRSRSAGA